MITVTITDDGISRTFRGYRRPGDPRIAWLMASADRPAATLAIDGTEQAMPVADFIRWTDVLEQIDRVLESGYTDRHTQ